MAVRFEKLKIENKAPGAAAAEKNGEKRKRKRRARERGEEEHEESSFWKLIRNIWKLT